MDFNAVITGDRRVVARFSQWPAELHDALYARIQRADGCIESQSAGAGAVAHRQAQRGNYLPRFR